MQCVLLLDKMFNFAPVSVTFHDGFVIVSALLPISWFRSCSRGLVFLSRCVALVSHVCLLDSRSPGLSARGRVAL